MAMSSITATSSTPCAAKPMALLNLVYREQLFPRRAYQRAFEALLARRRREAGVPHHGRAAGAGP